MLDSEEAHGFARWNMNENGGSWSICVDLGHIVFLMFDIFVNAVLVVSVQGRAKELGCRFRMVGRIAAWYKL